jgi:hypothetical protein
MSFFLDHTIHSIIQKRTLSKNNCADIQCSLCETMQNKQRIEAQMARSVL